MRYYEDDKNRKITVMFGSPVNNHVLINLKTDETMKFLEKKILKKTKQEQKKYKT